jgi:hypothetical protein
MYDDLLVQSSLFNLIGAIRKDLGTPTCLFARPPAPGRQSDRDMRIGVSGTLRLRDVAAEAKIRCAMRDRRNGSMVA